MTWRSEWRRCGVTMPAIGVSLRAAGRRPTLRGVHRERGDIVLRERWKLPNVSVEAQDRPDRRRADPHAPVAQMVARKLVLL